MTPPSTAGFLLLVLVLLAGAGGCSSDAAAPEAEPLAGEMAPAQPLSDVQLSDSLTAADLLVARLERIDRRLQMLQARNDSLIGVLADQRRGFGLALDGRLAWVIFLLMMAWALHWLVGFAFGRRAERNQAKRYLYLRWVPFIRMAIWLLFLLAVLKGIYHVGAGRLVAALAAVGIGVAFAAQDLLKNLFGGLVVYFDQPFQVEDKISVGGTYGRVVKIGLRSTRIQTPDDNLVTVPNSQVADSQVANANAGALDCQVVTDLYLPGWIDEAKAKRLAYRAAASSKYVYLQKPIVVLVRDEFRETFLTHLKVKAYVLDNAYEFLLMSDITERARAAFREHGLLYPFHGRSGLDLLPPGSEPLPAEGRHAVESEISSPPRPGDAEATP